MSEQVYDYEQAIYDDIVEWLKDNDYDPNDKDFDEEQAFDDARMTITGDDNGSYFCNSWKAEEALNHNREYLEQAIEEYGYDDPDYLKKVAFDPELGDILVRDYLYPQVWYDVMKALQD